jgi:hypothetical protein
LSLALYLYISPFRNEGHWDDFDNLEFYEVLKFFRGCGQKIRCVNLSHHLMEVLVSGSDVAPIDVTSVCSVEVVAKANISPTTEETSFSTDASVTMAS